MLVENGMSAHAAELLHNLHVNTWFSAEAVNGVVKTTVGTLAGHPLADLIFALADAEVDAWYQAELGKAGLLVTLPTDGVAERWGLDEEATDTFPLEVAIRRPAYCDDAIVPLIAEAAMIITNLALAAVIGQMAYARFGMMVNFKAGNTEANVRFRGKGSEAARRCAIVHDKSVIRCESRIGMDFELRIVPKYKHLGGWLSSASNYDADMAYRGAIMSQAVAPIKKRFLHCPEIEMEEKTHVVASLVLSKGLHMAGTWPALNGSEHSRLRPPLHACFGRFFLQLRVVCTTV